MRKKRPDGVTVYVTENRLDGRLPPLRYIRKKGYNHYTFVPCPVCKTMMPVSKARAFVCLYTEPNEKSVVKHGELAFCSYECILDWLPRHHFPDTDQ